MNKKIDGAGREREESDMTVYFCGGGRIYDVKSGLNDPDCAQIDAGNRSIASVSAESHGLTLPTLLGKVTSTLLSDFTFGLHLPSQMLPYCGVSGRGRGASGRGRGGSGRGGRSIGKVADAEGRSWSGMGSFVNNAGQRGRTRPEEHRAPRTPHGAHTESAATKAAERFQAILPRPDRAQARSMDVGQATVAAVTGVPSGVLLWGCSLPPARGP